MIIKKFKASIGENVNYNQKKFENEVVAILSPKRTKNWGVEFRKVATLKAADFEIILSTPENIKQICWAIDNVRNLSCADIANKVIFINFYRWMHGSNFHHVNMKDYRKYVINHEVLHILGMQHQQCPGPGELAPVLLQQTDTLDGCIFNPEPLDFELDILHNILGIK